VGGDFTRIKTSYVTFPAVKEAAGWLKGQDLKGKSVLVKGSRSMKMEDVLN